MGEQACENFAGRRLGASVFADERAGGDAGDGGWGYYCCLFEEGGKGGGAGCYKDLSGDQVRI